MDDAPKKPKVQRSRTEEIIWRLLFWAIVGVISWVVYCDLVMGEGSPRYARKWMARLSEVSSFKEAKERWPGLFERTLPSGESVFGIADNSHGNPFGGTVVMRDSNGKVSAYFGHVCGVNGIGAYVHPKRSPDLKSLYGALDHAFTQWQPEGN